VGGASSVGDNERNGWWNPVVKALLALSLSLSPMPEGRGEEKKDF